MPQNRKNTVNKEKPLVLIAPLDWGLGHTTRIIPLLDLLLSWNINVLIACNSQQRALLEIEFPTVRFVALNGYNLVYGHTRTRTMTRIAFQIPGIFFSIIKEKLWLTKFLKKNRVDVILSDNRYGLYAHSTKSYLITHQLEVKTGFGKRIDRLFQRIGYGLINRFDGCLVPDFEGPQNLAGELSHPKKLPTIPVKYLGALSRFNVCSGEKPAFGIMVIISGPEPQRTVFEEQIIRELNTYPHKAVVVRGLPGNTEILNSTPDITVINHASSKELNKLLCLSDIIIARPGYTTVMDLLKLKKKSIFIPTPGQTEQEYLGSYLHEQKLALTISQDKFSLVTALADFRTFEYKNFDLPMDQYKKVLADLMEHLLK